jgi:type IV pilus assembly protein PilA
MIKKLRKNRGFTLIELMIVVAIVGILAVLAIFGVSKYLANAKSAEATNTIGKINERAVAGYEEENNTAELAVQGNSGSASTHQLCISSANSVPLAVTSVANKKYQPDTRTATADYNTGASSGIARGGWKCLKFEMTQPQYYQYGYATGTAAPIGMVFGAGAPGVPATGWNVLANGDLDADTNLSSFMTGGDIDATSKKPITFTQVHVVEPEE